LIVKVSITSSTAAIPYVVILETWALIAFLGLCGLGLLMKLFTKRYSKPPAWMVWLAFPTALAASVSFALALLATHTYWLDHLPKNLQPHEDLLKHKLAWMYSMLLTCMGAIAMLIMAFFIKIASKRGLLGNDIW
jgi:hypothetical protein